MNDNWNWIIFTGGAVALLYVPSKACRKDWSNIHRVAFDWDLGGEMKPLIFCLILQFVIFYHDYFRIKICHTCTNNVISQEHYRKFWVWISTKWKQLNFLAFSTPHLAYCTRWLCKNQAISNRKHFYRWKAQPSSIITLEEVKPTAKEKWQI